MVCACVFRSPAQTASSENQRKTEVDYELFKSKFWPKISPHAAGSKIDIPSESSHIAILVGGLEHFFFIFPYVGNNHHPN